MANPFYKKIYEIRPTAFGLDIGDPAVRVLKLNSHSKSDPVELSGQVELEPGIVDAGKIIKEAELIKALQDLLKKVGDGSNHVIASLPEQESFIRAIKLPALKDSEILSALQAEIEANIPLPIDELYFGWQILKSKAKNPDHVDVLVAAAPKSLIDSYIRVFKGAKLKIKALEIESFSLARAVIPKSSGDEPILILDFGSKRTGFTIVAGGTIIFTSSVSISSDQLTESIAKDLGISFPEAEKLKKQYGLDRSTQGGKIFKAQEAVLNELIKQVSGYIDFYHEHSQHDHELKRKSISKMIICGGGANLLGLASLLELKLRIPCELANPWINILGDHAKQIPSLPFAKSLSYSTVLGLAMLGSEE